jgi:hypothetical protein
MIPKTRMMFALGAALILCANARHVTAAPPNTAAYTFACTPNSAAIVGESQVGTTAAFSVPATGYNFQIPSLNIGSGSSGAGAGKVTFSPLTIELPAVQFTGGVYAALAGASGSVCTLTPSNSALPSYSFQLVILGGVSLSGNDQDGDGDDHKNGGGVVTLTLQFGAMSVQTAGGGS